MIRGRPRGCWRPWRRRCRSRSTSRRRSPGCSASERVVLPAGDRQTVSAVSYLGDAGGIVCHIVPPDGGDVAFVSLTHVRVPPSMPLAAEVLRYQKHRVKKLRQQGKG